MERFIQFLLRPETIIMLLITLFIIGRIIYQAVNEFKIRYNRKKSISQYRMKH